jgi:hypothetical protein
MIGRTRNRISGGGRRQLREPGALGILAIADGAERMHGCDGADLVLNERTRKGRGGGHRQLPEQRALSVS